MPPRADQPEDAILPNPTGVAEITGGGRILLGSVGGDGFQLFELHQGGEQVVDLGRSVGKAVGILGEGRPLPGPMSGDEVLGKAVQRVAVGGRVGHHVSSQRPGTWLRLYLRPPGSVHRDRPKTKSEEWERLGTRLGSTVQPSQESPQAQHPDEVGTFAGDMPDSEFRGVRQLTVAVAVCPEPGRGGTNLDLCRLLRSSASGYSPLRCVSFCPPR